MSDKARKGKPPTQADIRPSRFVRMFKCDTARLSRFPNKIFLIIGWKRNTRQDTGQWVKNGDPINFDYVHERVVASGASAEELLMSALLYKAYSELGQRSTPVSTTAVPESKGAWEITATMEANR